jgi:apolipoprotein N-acyltransferase
MDSDRKRARLVELGASVKPFLLRQGEAGGRLRLTRDAWLLAVVSGVLQSLIYPLPALTFLCWVALAPLLVAILRGRKPAGGGQAQPVSAGQGFLLAYVGGVIWSFATTYWIYHVMHIYGGLDGPTSFGVLILFCFALGLIWGVFGLVMAILANAPLRHRALFLAPFVWVPLEIVRGFPFDFPWDPLGTVLVNNIPLTRIATATGVYGLSFEIVLVNTAFAAAFLVDRKRRSMVLIAAVVVAGLLQSGELVKPPRLAADRTARLIQSNIPILNEPWSAQYFQRTLRELRDVSVQRQGELGPTEPAPDLLVWPESPAPFFINNPEFRAAVSDVARRARVTVVVGSLGLPNTLQSTSQLYNSAAVIAPNGDWIARYDKIHLVPFGEYVPFKRLLSFAGKLTREVGDFIPGESRKALALGNYRMGVFICYEAVYPGEIREFAKNGAQVFVNISDDGWFGQTAAPVQHLNQARMRAIENNRWLLRSTDTGITVAVDPYGRVVAQAPRSVRTYIDAPYSIISGTTFYTRHGNWFLWVCAIISLMALVARARARTIP